MLVLAPCFVVNRNVRLPEKWIHGIAKFDEFTFEVHIYKCMTHNKGAAN